MALLINGCQEATRVLHMSQKRAAVKLKPVLPQVWLPEVCDGEVVLRTKVR